MNAAGEGEGGTNWASSIETYTLAYANQTASRNLLYDARSSTWSSVNNLEGWDGVVGGGGRFKREETYL